MPVFNTQIKGSGGTQPTGTLGINVNGVYNVTNYEYADVQVPTQAPAHYIEYPVNASGELVEPTSISTLNLPKVIGQYGLQNAILGNKTITTVDLSNIEIVKDFGLNGFASGSVLVSADLSSVVYATSSSFTDFCRLNAHFTTIVLSSLKYLDGFNVFSNAFRSAGISILNFPALKNISNSGFGLMLTQTNNVVVHAPSNMQSTIEGLSGYPNFSGTNATWLFDLPATNILTGANSVNYERNPKYDTATALAWRMQDTGTVPNFVIDWTPYYTSGIADPQVNGTIYSDSACTVAVTTISSIS